jgi:DNA gyrase subunit A
VLRIRTAEGYELTGTANHPVLCLEDVLGVPMLLWRMLGEIGPDTVVALSRPGEPPADAIDENGYALGLLLGAFVAEGYASEGRAGFNNTDKAYFDEVLAAYDRIVGGPRYVSERKLKSGKTIHELDVQRLDAFRASPLSALIGFRSAEKHVPACIWRATPSVKAAFLQGLYEGDGSMGLSVRSSLAVIYSSRSEQLCRDVQQLLLEFGVVSSVRTRQATGEVRVVINNRRNVRRFARNVGFHGAKRDLLEQRLAAIPLESTAMSRDHIPFLADYVRAEAGRGGLEWLKHHNIDRVERWDRDGELILSKIASDEVKATIQPLVESGYYYARVASVEHAGTAPVYSLRVASDDHSFIANGFVNHNTECRLGTLATHMLAGIDEDTVDFQANYTNEFEEPTVLPSRFPNLLVNGSQGIAVAMATNIPPHNLGEVIDGTLHLIDNPEATADDLMQFIKGPDFPTGGLILGRAGIIEAYRTGRGSIRMRARAEIEETKSGGSQIVVTELPYQASPAALEQKVAELVNARELDGIRDIQNLSAGIDTKIVFPLKRDANANVVLNNLFKQTTLQTSFGVNMVALVDGVPRTLNLVQMLQHYIDHQVDVITRRSQFRLKKAQDRAHIVEGLLKALDMIDAIIALIRGSEDRPAARVGLMAAPFEFSEIQANHILDMTLGRLTRLGRSELEREMAELRETIAELESILNDPVKLRGVIKTEMTEIKDQFATDRRAEITYDPGEMNAEDFIDDAPLVVTMTKAGYIKTTAAASFKTQGRGGRGVAGAKLKEEDLVTQIIHTSAHAYLLFFSNTGKVYRLKAHEVPMKERTARGTAIVNLLPLAPDEKIQAIIDTRDYPEDRFLFFATRTGQVKKTAFSEYDKSRREGFIAINLHDDDELVRVLQTNGSDDIFMVSRNGVTIRFNETDVRPMGRSAAGVRGMRMKTDDVVVSCDVARDETSILIVTESGYGKRTQLDKFNRQTRGGQGVRGIKLTAKKGYVVSAFMVALDDEIFVVSSAGVTVRMGVRGISSQGRDATGVKVMNLDSGTTVASAALILDKPSDEDDVPAS